MSVKVVKMSVIIIKNLLTKTTEWCIIGNTHGAVKVSTGILKPVKHAEFV